MKKKDFKKIISDQPTALDIYLSKTFSTTIMLAPTIGVIACFVYTIGAYTGFLENVAISSVLIFDAINIFFLITCIFFANNTIDTNGIIRKERYSLAKVTIVIVLFVQWLLYLHMTKSSEIWSAGMALIALSLLFLDSTTTDITSILIISSFLIFDLWNNDISEILYSDERFKVVLIRSIVIIVFAVVFHITTEIGHDLLINELDKAANSDPLTGLYNRRPLANHLYNVSIESKKTPISIAFIDIDDFKSVNDNFDHETGDKLLCEISNIIKKTLKINETAYRWGGEEFLLILKREKQDAIDACESIRKQVEDLKIVCKEKRILHSSVTIGVSSYKEDDDIYAPIQRADILLYKGKKDNKNIVVND